MSARSARLPSLADLLRQQPGLRGLIWFSGVDGLCFGAVSATLTPLALTIYDERMLGVILAAAGLGALAGGVLTMVLGDKWLGIRGFLVAQVMVGLGLVGVAADKSPAFLAVVAFVVMAATSLCIAVETTLIQRHTPRAGLGRMLGRAGLIRGLGVAVGILGAGALADMLLEPGLRPGGALSGWSVFTWWGLGPGQGYRSLFVLAGLGALAALLIFIMHGGWRALLPSAASTTPPRDD
jgi:MFS family permease